MKISVVTPLAKASAELPEIDEKPPTAVDEKPLSERSAKFVEQVEKLTKYFNERGEAADARDKKFKADVEEFDRGAKELFAAFEKYRGTLSTCIEAAIQSQANYVNMLGLLIDRPDIINFDRATPEFKALFQVISEERAKERAAK
jgi:hypothetical protein